MQEVPPDQAHSLAGAQAIGLIIIVFGVLAGVGFNMIDKYNEEKLAEKKHQHDISMSMIVLNNSTSVFMP
jgi:uncharacterized membrane-anchored protein